ncbi:TPA: tail fiber assembly protein [Kluyvera ascorbata F0526]|nr:tail fiber assembly protein [Kluyvera ascorbata F0526]
MFYSTEIGFTVGRVNDDQVEITDEYWSELVVGQAGGKVITTDESGRPVLIEAAPQTHEQLVTAAEQKKTSLRIAADSEIAWRQDAVDAGIATDKEIAALSEWKKYRVLLMRVDTSKAPDIEWPHQPASQ